MKLMNLVWEENISKMYLWLKGFNKTSFLKIPWSPQLRLDNHFQNGCIFINNLYQQPLKCRVHILSPSCFYQFRGLEWVPWVLEIAMLSILYKVCCYQIDLFREYKVKLTRDNRMNSLSISQFEQQSVLFWKVFEMREITQNT